MRKKTYEVWFDKARDNLKWAKDNLRAGNYPLVCYLSQQAGELAIKGLIYSRKVIPPKTHHLIRLAEVCKKNGISLEEIYPILSRLSEYYFESRYPDEANQDLNHKRVAEKAFEDAKRAVEKIVKSL